MGRFQGYPTVRDPEYTVHFDARVIVRSPGTGTDILYEASNEIGTLLRNGRLWFVDSHRGFNPVKAVDKFIWNAIGSAATEWANGPKGKAALAEADARSAAVKAASRRR